MAAGMKVDPVTTRPGSTHTPFDNDFVRHLFPPPAQGAVCLKPLVSDVRDPVNGTRHQTNVKLSSLVGEPFAIESRPIEPR